MVDQKNIPQETEAITKEQMLQRLQLSLKNGSVSFVTELFAIENLLPFNDKGFIDATSDFLNQQELDLFLITSEAMESGQDAFRVAHILIQIFPRLSQIEPKSLLIFLKIYDEKTKNDLMSGRLFDPIRKRTFSDREWGLSLEAEILKNEDKRFYSYLLSIYLGLSDLDYLFGYNKLKEAYLSPIKELKTTGLRGLGLLSKLPAQLKSESINALILGVDSADEVVASNAAFSLARLSQDNEELNTKRIELSKTAMPAVRFEILREIQFKQGELSAGDVEIIKNLCEQSINFKGILDSLNNIIYFLLKKNHYEATKSILTAWVSAHSLEEHRQYNITEIFNSSILEIANNKSFLETIITEWFNSDDFRYHHVLQEIISYLGIHGVKTLGFNLEILKTFDEVDLLYIIRKVLGFTHDFDISISLILSLLNVDSLSNKTATLVASALIQHIGDNYLIKTIDRINLEIINNVVAGSEKFKALKKAAQVLQKRKDQRSELPNCDELMPNADHQAELNKAFHKTMSDSMKKSREKSFFFNMVSRVAIKEGLSTFSFMNGEHREPSKMSSFSHGIELPKKDVLDEVGASFERSGFRLARRGEQ